MAISIQKLSNGFTYSNPFFQDVFAEYLFQNGFCVKEIWNQLHFTKRPLKLVVLNSNMDVFQYDPTEEEESQQWKFSHQLDGFEKMDIAEFIYTMDASKITAIADFVDNAYALDKQLGVEAKLLMKAISTNKNFKLLNPAK